MSGAEAPLIAGAEHIDPENPLLDEDDAAVSVVKARDGDADAAAAPGLFVWLLTLSAGISGLLFGYDTGVISATLVSVGTSLSGRALTSLDKSVVTSATALAALLVSPTSSALADALGRRRVILLAAALFVAGALAQAAARTVAAMVLGRAVVGAAVGAASFVVPLYIAELAPAAHRGRLVTVNVVFITLGQVVAYAAGWALTGRTGTGGADDTGNWRLLVGLGAAPAVVQAVLVGFMPETPRWLVKEGRAEEARAALGKVVGGGAGGGAREADALLREIEREVREEDEAARLRRRSPKSRLRWMDTWDELFAVRRNRRALAIACLLQGLQQLCGFNSLMYFSATIFTMLGFTSPTLTSMTVAATNFVFTVIALLIIDRVGRRRVLLYSIPFMVVGLLLAAYGFSIVDIPSSSGDDGTPAAGGGGDDKRGAGVILFSIMIYVAAYAMGLGNVPWMQSELFALGVRSLGSGVATATNWGANFVVGLTFLPLMEVLTPPWTFGLYALVCAGGVGCSQAQGVGGAAVPGPACIVDSPTSETVQPQTAKASEGEDPMGSSLACSQVDKRRKEIPRPGNG
ncbi:uncharacterized protein E0L32_006369 [Thyridium curvatum]|uniref:Major facilitator superfamily (MFS) profile domain-containing protein n=1 Tax=Thyridium curvatum TaxID=1093900 RepID=A0A507B6Y6_9PEZI|nr:uncharacterized protein E0L32_006369 [Thyridium curvatum]TPX13169.1 hypothetical protein E0L32_006369 [Thyridium curvatum]